MGRKARLAGLAAVVAGVLALPPGAGADTSAAPTSITFASNQTVGTTSAPQAVTVTVTCTTVIIVCADDGDFVPGPVFTGFAAGDFSQTNNCGLLVESPGICQFSVTFTPTATGVRTATLHVGDDISGSFLDPAVDPAPVSLTGSGVAAAVPPPSTTPATTGQRDAAIKKCKKKYKGKAKAKKRKKCINKAKKKPV